MVAIVLMYSIKTFSYGIWTIKQKNISGGIMIQLLAVFSLALSAYFMLKP